MPWFPLDAILIVLFATLYTGFYALLGARGYHKLLVGWLAGLAGAILGYFLGHAIGLHFLWLGSLPWPEVTLGSLLLIVVASRLRI